MLMQREIAYGGHMVAAMAVMEFPAIIVGVFLGRRFATAADEQALASVHSPSAHAHTAKKSGFGHLLHEACTNGSIVLLVGSMAVGLLTTDAGATVTAPLWKDLLDLGLVAGRNATHVIRAGWPVIAFALVFPFVNSLVGAGLAKVLGLHFADGFIIMVMAASASYIAVPAALRLALPTAQASIYVPMALTLTFPLNIVVGLPVYWVIAQRLFTAA